MTGSILDWIGSGSFQSTVDGNVLWATVSKLPEYTISLGRGATDLPAQTVHIVWTNQTQTNEIGEARSMAASRVLSILGPRNHDTLTDFDIKRDDRFIYEGEAFRVVDVINWPDITQAFTERLT